MTIWRALPLLLLVACVAPPSSQIPMNPAEPCREGLLSDPAFASIKGKVYLGRDQDQPFEMLTAQEKPTEQEKPGILAWLKARQACFSSSQSWRQYYFSPRINAWANGVQSGHMGNGADLYAGTITYGEFAKRRAKLIADAQNEFSLIQQQEYDSAVRAAPRQTNCYRDAFGITRCVTQ